jgi:hypothetical protein
MVLPEGACRWVGKVHKWLDLGHLKVRPAVEGGSVLY